MIVLTIGMLAAATFTISPATAGKLLTKKRALRLFYPRAEADAKFIDVGEKAAGAGTADNADTLDNIDSTGFLTPAEGDASYLPATGEVRINASPMSWVKTNPAITQVPQANPSIGSTTFGGSSSAATGVPFAISPTLPTVLSDRSLELVGVNACYGTDATTLSTVRIWVTDNASGGGSSSAVFTDTEDRTDDNCRDYTLTTPRPIAPTEDVTLEFSVDYSSNAQFFSAGRATFILNIV